MTFIPHEHCEIRTGEDCWAKGKCLRYGSSCSRYWAENTTEFNIPCTRGEAKEIQTMINHSGREAGDVVRRALSAWLKKKWDAEDAENEQETRP